ncbi:MULTISPECIES: hypothetical protein [Pseudoxanthomonas]|jgi:hypothetical protein|uniref:hypothetical protein n=1 Tax=Pseudoxanthomonas TaxID=83618 RepID=UPI00160E83B3|nr:MULTISPECIES: hypothetical protein [Pseudoxanthomonas]MBB3275334.1 hypothetical protein [Pseudoxanthomonas sp. OG2]MBD9376922.1 hypothetical protein [Pseudoxanthomonas sp. PXM04]MBV7473576.1 hypothetical protein [Pseudoxanthomonas sp. PXM05]UBB24271.1 hypothetical protein LAG73_12915 [Pseudoxanthomonas japonensis]
MNPAHEHDFDARARQAHAAALAQVSPRTLARLRAARHSAPASQRRAWPWLTATAFSAVLAVMIGLQWLPSSPAPAPESPEPAITAATPDAALPANTLLDENPDLYLWLASSEAPPLAME